MSTADHGLGVSRLRAWLTLVNNDPRLPPALLRALLGAMLLILPAIVFAELIPFLRDGIWTTGRVIAKFPVVAERSQFAVPVVVIAHGGGRRGESRPKVQFEFSDAAGVLHRGTGGIPQNEWERLQVGDPIDVVYLASDPKQHRVWTGFESQHLIGLVMGTIGLLLIASCFWSGAQAVASIAREVRLLREGTLTVGRVTAQEVTSHRRRDALITVDYIYSAPTTLSERLEEFTGRHRSSGGAMFAGPAGSSIPIVFDPRAPEISTADAYGLRRAEFENLALVD